MYNNSAIILTHNNTASEQDHSMIIHLEIFW